MLFVIWQYSATSRMSCRCFSESSVPRRILAFICAVRDSLMPDEVTLGEAGCMRRLNSIVKSSQGICC